ncbi:helix-turn-helix domain-containing protein [Actinomadura bangladeshensis]|uniref:XRE family transcriptional regulator n=1 Tax=Actinomadura bangladeshensis TaxID=453573 RepID=A0A4R4PE15_9ACTN|nr:helix-turn-helix transcriptional regulator [Actinomadura bangladeshensis]TDC19730.1 XRE family transcriptional regulator [Actinomadura bangladeshensis]
MQDASISDRVRELRRRRGMTQEELAEQANLSLAVIKKLEQGGTCRMETYHHLARALGVTTVWFASAGSPEPTEATVDEVVLADMRSAINPPVGFAGRPLYGTADGDHPDLARLGRAVSAVAAKYHADAYDDLAVFMPALVRSAHHHVEVYNTGEQRQEALRLRADITGLVGRYLIQIRAHDLALIALHASLRDALEIGDVPLATASVSSQAWAMLRQGRLAEVERLCVDTAGQIEPKMSKASPDELSGWGYLLLRAAAAASRNNRADEAREYVRAAGAAGARLGRQHENLAGHVAFGPLTPALLGPEIELLDGRPDQALELARDLPRDVGAANTSGWDRHRLDVARAKLQTGDPEKATEIMQTIRAEHPSWLRYQQYGRDITRELLGSRPRMPSQAMLDLADFMGVEP